MNALFAAMSAAMINGVVLSLPVILVAWLALRFMPRTALNAATRCGLLWAVLLFVLLLPALSQRPTVSHRSASSVPAGAVFADEIQEHALSSTEVIPAPHPAPIEVFSNRGPNVVLSLWAITTLVMLMRLAVSWIVLERRKARAVTAPEDLKCRADGWMKQCGSRRRVDLRIVPVGSAGPIATGPWRPSILFPTRFLDDFSDHEIEQIGLHEAAHLARFDDYWLTIQRIVEALFFFHPAVHWITRQINLEREIACDDFVVQLTGSGARRYAACLTHVAEMTAGNSPSLIAAGVTDERTHLEIRIELLLDKTRHMGTRLLRARFGAGLAALFFLAEVATQIPVLFSVVAPMEVLAQVVQPKSGGTPAYVTPGPAAPGTPGSIAPKRIRPEIVKPVGDDDTLNAEIVAAPRFTSATITPVEWHMGGVAETSEPGRVDYKMMGIKRLFFLAWPMQNYRFLWPDWLTEPSGNINAWYDVSATMPADTTPEQKQLMLQALLADHFKMSAHWETRNMDIYAVTISPGGIKFQKSSNPSNPGTKGITSQAGWHMVPRLPRQSDTDPSGMTLAQFTQSGSAPGFLDRPMVDMTGLEGVYDIDLTVPRDPDTPWPLQLPGPASPTTAAERAQAQGWRKEVFFQSMDSQLGLIVEPQTVPVKMLVVDNLDLVPAEK